MTSFALAWRTAQRYRARTVLAIAGVAVIGALLFDMLLLSRGLLISFGNLLESAGFDVRVVAGEGLGAMRLPIAGSARLADDILGLAEVQRVALIRIEPANVRAAAAPPREITIVGTTDVGAGAWRLVSGANLGTPAAAANRCPLIVARPLASALGLAPGSALALSMRPPGVPSALPPVACRVVGIAEFAFAATDDETAATTMDAFREAIGGGGSTDADLVLVSSRSVSEKQEHAPSRPASPARTGAIRSTIARVARLLGARSALLERAPREAGAAAAARAIQQMRPDLRVYSNDDVVAEFNRNGFAYFQQISLVLSSVTMVFAFLLVATLLTVSINQRLGEIAALRALGIGRRRIASMLLWESVLLVGTGGLLALPLGTVLALGLDRILRQMPGLPEQLHFFVFEPRALVIHVLLLAFTAFAAAAYPVWLTARLPIAATLRREVIG